MSPVSAAMRGRALESEPHLTVPVEVREVSVGSVTLEVRLAGPVDGRPVLLLHGFPECWWSWCHQIGPLVDAGYRVIVPHQRGYGTSDKPAGLAAYSLDLLIGDLAGLLDALGYTCVRVAGHDWGAIVAWWFGHRMPDRVERQVLLSGPHPDVLRRAIRSPPQMFKSWYIYCFQLPWIPEIVVGSRRLRTMEWIVNTGVRKYSSEDLRVFRTQWLIPGTVNAMINWYRAFLRTRNAAPARGPIEPRTLVLWGTSDKALGTELAGQSAALCRDGRVEVFDGVGHWLPHEAAELVTRRLLAFFGAP